MELIDGPIAAMDACGGNDYWNRYRIPATRRSMPRMTALLLLLASVACRPGALPGVALPGLRDEAPSPNDTIRTPAATYHDKLGVNVTWANDQLITGDPTYASTAFRHVRYFQMMEKDFGGGQTPATATLSVCDNLDNPWACPEQSMRQHLVRVQKLRQMFPEGYIWIAPEVIGGKTWPCKGYTVDELGPDPEEAGYQWARVALATYGPVGNVILAMTNEEWCAEAGRAAAYNEWRRGVIRAHIENPSCQLALGATHVRRRTWQGEQLPDNVADVAADVWSYINLVGGWADFHAHGLGADFRFSPHETAHLAHDYADFFAWCDWLEVRYPDIRRAVGEIAYTTSAPDVVGSDAEKEADWPTYRRLIEGVAAEADVVFLYQLKDHGFPEGAFSGSGVFPALKDEIEAFGREPLPAQ